jgi:hypothetical protein
MGIEVILVQGLALIVIDGDSSVSALFMSLGSSVFLLVFPLMRLHLKYTSYNMTEKEYWSRVKTCKLDRNMTFDENYNTVPMQDFRIELAGFCSRVGNLCHFFFNC